MSGRHPEEIFEVRRHLCTGDVSDTVSRMLFNANLVDSPHFSDDCNCGLDWLETMAKMARRLLGGRS